MSFIKFQQSYKSFKKIKIEKFDIIEILAKCIINLDVIFIGNNLITSNKMKDSRFMKWNNCIN
jgi:hypothetical protein